MSETTRETQATISHWCELTFGPVSTNVRVAIRANEELAELMEKVASDAPAAEAGVEVADVVIVLTRLASRLGVGAATLSLPGKESSLARAVAAVNKEMASLLRSLALDDNNPNARGLLCRLLSSLYGLGPHLGLRIADEVDSKMAINRARVWKLDGSGHGYHVPPQA